MIRKNRLDYFPHMSSSLLGRWIAIITKSSAKKLCWSVDRFANPLLMRTTEISSHNYHYNKEICILKNAFLIQNTQKLLNIFSYIRLIGYLLGLTLHSIYQSVLSVCTYILLCIHSVSQKHVNCVSLQQHAFEIPIHDYQHIVY